MATRKKKTPAKKAAPKLPRGYTAISGGGKAWPNDDTPIGDVVQGTVIEFDEFKGKYGIQQTAVIECKDGTLVKIYESAATSGLFEYEEGIECYLVFNGIVDNGDKTYKDITTAVKE